jgi:hypothetical protein
MAMTNEQLLYIEQVSSPLTEKFFAGISSLFFLLFIWRLAARKRTAVTRIFLLLGGFFFFYTLNYRTLTIRLTAAGLRLQFGLFSWFIPRDNIRAGRLDDQLPLLLEFGGAGVHFYWANGAYRASFNFLEHPRVAVELARPSGPIREISFSTRYPAALLREISRVVD